jgi:uncharacterized membrane protein YeaQ/YmgE (transglycosylase-associated protein family)
MNTTSRGLRLLVFLLLLAAAMARPASAAQESSLADSAKQAGEDAQRAVEVAVENTQDAMREAGESVEATFEELWRSIDENRLKNRTPDQLVAWAIMGALVGGLTGMLTQLKTTGMGRMARLFLGLAGAFIGGMLVHVSGLDFGLGPVLIRYEDLLFAFFGALLLIGIGRVFRSRSRKPPAQH